MQGTSLLKSTINKALQAAVGPVTVVLGANAVPVKNEIEQLPVNIVVNEQWQQGIAGSVKKGIESISSANAALIMTCDQPFITAGILKEMADTFSITNKKIVACKYSDTIGIPALFDKSLFAELNTLKGDAGAKKIIYANIKTTTTIDFPEGEIDIDTPEAYNEVIKNRGYDDRHI